MTTAFSLATLSKNLPVKYESTLLLGQIDAAEGNIEGARSKFYAIVSSFTHEARENRPSDVEAARAYNGLGVLATQSARSIARIYTSKRRLLCARRCLQKI